MGPGGGHPDDAVPALGRLVVVELQRPQPARVCRDAAEQRRAHAGVAAARVHEERRHGREEDCVGEGGGGAGRPREGAQGVRRVGVLGAGGGADPAGGEFLGGGGVGWEASPWQLGLNKVRPEERAESLDSTMRET